MEENNLELRKEISFDELIQHGLNNGANVNNGMPWHWKINGKAITHENDNCYIIETIDGMQHFNREDNNKIIAVPEGLMILLKSNK